MIQYNNVKAITSTGADGKSYLSLQLESGQILPARLVRTYQEFKARKCTSDTDGVDIIAKTYASEGNYQTIYVLWTDRELHIPCITFWRYSLSE